MKDRKNQLKHINPDELKALSLIDKMKAIGIWQRGDRILENVCQPFDLPAQREIAQSAIAQLQQTISIAQQIHDFSKGLGLSAPQIGLPLQVALYTARMKPGQLLLTYEEYKEKSQPWKYPKDSI